MPKVTRDTWVALKVAAAQLGEERETTRLRVGRGELRGEQRGARREWFIEPQSLAKLVASRGGSRAPDVQIHQLELKVDSLASAVDRLTAELRALGGQTGGSAAIDSLRLERDRYRAEASTMREAAMRSNAAQRSMAEGFREVLDAVAENADAVTELLGPRDVSDLFDRREGGYEREVDDFAVTAEAFWGG